MMDQREKKVDPEEFLNLLGNTYRRQIIKLLSSRKLYPQQISEILGITPSAVIKNLRILEEAGLLNKEEVDRDSGGRPLQFFSVQRNFSFSFDMFNPSLIKIVALVPKERDLLKTHIKQPKEQIIENFQTILDIQRDLINIENARHEKLRHREHLYELLRDIAKDKYPANMVNIFRSLLELKGNQWFFRQDIEKEHGIRSEETTNILKAWEELDLIQVDTQDWINPKIRFKVGKR
jgi:predicted transcriptional regulator